MDIRLTENEFGKAFSNFGLKMDFTPIIQHFNLSGNYVFQHWQAKPFGYRQFGYMAVENNVSIYRTIPWGQCKHEIGFETIQVDEIRNLGRVPTAVNLFIDAILIPNKNVDLVNPFNNKIYKWILTKE